MRLPPAFVLTVLTPVLALTASHASAQSATSFVLLSEVPAPTGEATRVEGLTVFHGRALEPSTGTSITRGRLTVVTSSDAPAGMRVHALGSHAEAQWAMSAPGRRVQLAVGAGIRREREGSQLLIGRAAVTTRLGTSQLVGNVTVERPLDRLRDSMDVVTGVGWTRPASRSVRVGVEALGEDLEGLWNPQEADGGARLFAGPTLQVKAPHLNAVGRVTAGADLRGPNSHLGAVGAGGPAAARAGLALRTSLTLGF